MLRSVRVSAAKMKGLYTLWVSWNTLPGSRGASLTWGCPSRTQRGWTEHPSYLPPPPTPPVTYLSLSLPTPSLSHLRT